MDYVIAGLGSGAVLAIIGFLLRELGVSRRTSFPRWMAPAGVALMFAALIIWIVAAAAFFSGMDDDSALPVVAGSAVVATLGSLLAAGVMIRTYKPRPVLATVVAMAQRETEPTPAVAIKSESEDSEAGLAQTNQPSDDDNTDIQPGSETEKNWPEIWQQTWGTTPAPDAVDVAAEQSEAMADPVEEAVLESWGTSSDREAEVQPDQPEEKIADTGSASVSAQSGAGHPTEPVAGDSGAEDRANPALSDAHEVDTEPIAAAASEEDPDQASTGDSPQNGNEPKADLEEPETAADLASSR